MRHHVPVGLDESHRNIHIETAARVTVSVCTGGENLCKEGHELLEALRLEVQHQTPRGGVLVKPIRCRGLCSVGPVIIVELALLYGSVPPMNLGTPSTLTDLMQADCVVLVGVNPLLAHRVAGFLVRRVVAHGLRGLSHVAAGPG